MAIKGILWGIAFILTALIYLIIPTILIFDYWIFLNSLVDLEGRPIYTLALFAIFLFIVSLLVGLIYLVASARAFIQCRNEQGLGISKGVKGFGLVSDIIVISLTLLWYFLFNEILFLSISPPMV